MDNHFYYNEGENPNSIFDISKDLAPVIRLAIAKKFPEEYGRANIIVKDTRVIIELNLSEEQSFIVKAALKLAQYGNLNRLN